MSGNHIEIKGEIISHSRDCFKVVAGEVEVLAKLSGKMRKNNIRLVEGDIVTVHVSPYDTSRGIIKVRH